MDAAGTGEEARGQDTGQDTEGRANLRRNRGFAQAPCE